MELGISVEINELSTKIHVHIYKLQGYCDYVRTFPLQREYEQNIESLTTLMTSKLQKLK